MGGPGGWGRVRSQTVRGLWKWRGMLSTVEIESPGELAVAQGSKTEKDRQPR